MRYGFCIWNEVSTGSKYGLRIINYNLREVYWKYKGVPLSNGPQTNQRSHSLSVAVYKSLSQDTMQIFTFTSLGNIILALGFAILSQVQFVQVLAGRVCKCRISVYTYVRTDNRMYYVGSAPINDPECTSRSFPLATNANEAQLGLTYCFLLRMSTNAGPDGFKWGLRKKPGEPFKMLGPRRVSAESQRKCRVRGRVKCRASAG
jgi:hypothetical protein